MAKHLFIVESPNKCRKINSFLGKEYIVMASVGHIRQIPKKGTNIDLKTFEPTYEITKDKRDVVKQIKDTAKHVDTIYLATDYDREGEAIAQSIYDILDKNSRKKCKRITFIEITKKAILDAISKPRGIDEHQVDAQKARQVLDRLIGYKISPLLWYAANIKKSSAGRVQSVALKIVCDRQKEIDKFKPENYWFIKALLKCKNGEFNARVVTKEKDNRYKNEKLATEDVAKLKKASFVIGSVERKAKKNNPPPPFDTNSLQATCSSVFGWTLKKSQSVAQKLYEEGLVTYIRSDSFNIAEEALAEVRNYIKSNEPKEYFPSKPNIYTKKSSASSQEAHECIRPTHIEKDENDISDNDKRKMYKLIRDRFIACQMKPQVVDAVTYNIKASSSHNLISRGQTVRFDGWTKAYKYVKVKELMLPNAEEKEKLELKKIEKTTHTTQPPPRFNEGSLAKIMEKEGVGRPSTRAGIITEIQKKGYVEKDKKSKGLIATDLGIAISQWLQPRFNDFFMDIKYTADLEEDLNKIADGKKPFLKVMNSFYDNLKEHIKKSSDKDFSGDDMDNETGEKCTACKSGNIVLKHGKFGVFYSCDKYPDCKTIFVKNHDGKFEVKGKPKNAKKCPECKNGKLVERKNKKEGNYFLGCTKYPKCKYTEQIEGQQKSSKSNETVACQDDGPDDLNDDFINNLDM